MLKDSDAFGSFSVDDLEAAKRFYEETLGLDVRETMGVLELNAGGRRAAVAYPKPDHRPASFTVLNFPVTDIEGIVAGLKSKGVTIELYDEGFLKTDENGIARDEAGAIAWFKDPAGNILSVIQEA